MCHRWCANCEVLESRIRGRRRRPDPVQAVGAPNLKKAPRVEDSKNTAAVDHDCSSQESQSVFERNRSRDDGKVYEWYMVGALRESAAAVKTGGGVACDHGAAVLAMDAGRGQKIGDFSSNVQKACYSVSNILDTETRAELRRRPA